MENTTFCGEVCFDLEEGSYLAGGGVSLNLEEESSSSGVGGHTALGGGRMLEEGSSSSRVEDHACFVGGGCILFSLLNGIMWV